MLARLRKSLVRLFSLLLALYCLAGVALYFFQENLLFHAETLPKDFHFALQLPFEERTIAEGPDPIHGLLVKAPDSHGLILYFHGNAGNLENWGMLAEDLAARLHWDIWMIDYPGFGKSGGALHSEDRLHRDADAVFFAAKREAGARPLVVMGRSVGTGLAVRLAALNSVSGLVLESPYFSMARLARRYYPWAPTFILRYPLNSFHWMPRVKSPALLLHGGMDELIPSADGAELAGLLPGARFILIEGGHHNDLGLFPRYWEELAHFLGGVSAGNKLGH